MEKTNLSPVNDSGMTFEKVDVQIIKPEAGEYFVGKLGSITERPWLDKKTGEEKTIKQLNLTDLEGKNPFAVFADAGLMNALNTAGIVAGDVIKCEKGEKVEMEGGRSVNTWSVYKAKTTH